MAAGHFVFKTIRWQSWCIA